MCSRIASAAQLDEMARAQDVPLLIDNAYGTPFPNIIFDPMTTRSGTTIASSA